MFHIAVARRAAAVRFAGSNDDGGTRPDARSGAAAGAEIAGTCPGARACAARGAGCTRSPARCAGSGAAGPGTSAYTLGRPRL
jgi:hypothetical protein